MLSFSSASSSISPWQVCGCIDVYVSRFIVCHSILVYYYVWRCVCSVLCVSFENGKEMLFLPRFQSSPLSFIYFYRRQKVANFAFVSTPVNQLGTFKWQRNINANELFRYNWLAFLRDRKSFPFVFCQHSPLYPCFKGDCVKICVGWCNPAAHRSHHSPPPFRSIAHSVLRWDAVLPKGASNVREQIGARGTECEAATH